MKKSLVKRILKSLKDRKGFTLVETIITLCITSIFFVGTASVLTTSSKMYLSSIKSSAARGAIETATDDIKNSIMSGKDIKLIFYMDGTRGSITGTTVTGTSETVNVTVSGTPLASGSILYTDGKYILPDGTTGTITLTPDQKEALESVAEGVDLGYKKIYVLPTTGERYADTIYGLPYGLKFYRGAELKLKITKSGPAQGFEYNDTDVPNRTKKEDVYNITLTGYDQLDVYVVKSNTATATLNNAVYN